jgi:hypothetical protein
MFNETLSFSIPGSPPGQPDVSVNIVLTLNDTPNGDGSYTVTSATGNYGTFQITGLAGVGYSEDGSDNKLFLDGQNGGLAVDFGGITFVTNGSPDGATGQGAIPDAPSNFNLYSSGGNYYIDTEPPTLVNAGGFSVSCFCAGTRIRTPDGEAPVERLKRGDLVLTADGAARAIVWLGVQTVATRFADPLRVTPIRVRAGALADNVPARDLLLSPEHALLVEDVLIQAGALVNGMSIVRESCVPPRLAYYHVELEDHSLILAENAPAETFIDNVDRLAFDNWREHEALYPDGKAMEEMPYPRARSHRQVPQRIRAALCARALEIGAIAAAA